MKGIENEFGDNNKIILFTLQYSEFGPEWDHLRAFIFKPVPKYSWMAYPYMEMLEIF